MKSLSCKVDNSKHHIMKLCISRTTIITIALGLIHASVVAIMQVINLRKSHRISILMVKGFKARIHREISVLLSYLITIFQLLCSESLLLFIRLLRLQNLHLLNKDIISIHIRKTSYQWIKWRIIMRVNLVISHQC
jgi:hypothetical protein